MSNSTLVNYTKLSPNYTKPRKDKIKKIGIHHMAGNLTVKQCGDLFAKESRKASSNYGIDSNGQVGMYVEEANRAWTSGNADNDNQAVTIEVANDGGEPDWHVSDKALNKIIELCVDICKRNDIKELKYTGDKSGNLTRHNMFQATVCPGPYLQGKFPYIAEQVNIKLSEVLYRVQAGAYSVKANAEAQIEKLKSAGFDTIMIKADGLYKIQVGAYIKKSNADNMLKKLKAAGFDAFITMKGGSAVPDTDKKSIDEIAKEVIKGKWGNGQERKDRLSAAGYDPGVVQKKVNELLL